MEQFFAYFPAALSWSNLAVLVAGSAGGLFFGAMPGLSPTMAVALLVPFTFYLPPATSLILLGAVYTSAVAGGSISAILLSIPGAPSSIATLFDGGPMAKKGRAQEALYTVFVSSLIGGVFGVLVMILFSPPLAEFAMRFGRFRHHGHHGAVFRGHAQGSLRRGAGDAPLDRRLQHPDRGTALRHP